MGCVRRSAGSPCLSTPPDHIVLRRNGRRTRSPLQQTIHTHRHRVAALAAAPAACARVGRRDGSTRQVRRRDSASLVFRGTSGEKGGWRANDANHAVWLSMASRRLTRGRGGAYASPRGGLAERMRRVSRGHGRSRRCGSGVGGRGSGVGARGSGIGGRGKFGQISPERSRPG